MALTANDLVTLTVLGTVFEGYQSYAHVLTAARSIASADWQPTGDLVTGALAKAINDGYLRVRGRTKSIRTARFAISSAGKARLRELLSRATPRCRDSLGRVATSLKVCFLGALGTEGACALLDDLSQGHLRELQGLRVGCEACPAAQGFAGRCVGREIERLEQELAWLGRVRADLTRDVSKRGDNDQCSEQP